MTRSASPSAARPSLVACAWLGLALVLGLALGGCLSLEPTVGLAPTAREPGALEASATIVPTSAPGRPTASRGHPIREGEPAPDFALQDLDGLQHSLSDHLGQVVLLNFWATWCEPCRVEMPELQKAYVEYADQGFAVLAVNWTAVDDRSQVAPFVAELGLTFPILLDMDGRVSELYQIIGLPSSVLIGGDGVIRALFFGPIPLDELEAELAQLLAEGG